MLGVVPAVCLLRVATARLHAHAMARTSSLSACLPHAADLGGEGGLDGLDGRRDNDMPNVPCTCLPGTATALSSSPTPASPTARHSSTQLWPRACIRRQTTQTPHWLLHACAPACNSRLPQSAPSLNAPSAAYLVLCSTVYGLPTTYHLPPFTTSLGTLRCTLPSAPCWPPSPLARRRQCTGARPRGDWPRRSRIELNRIAGAYRPLAPVAAAAGTAAASS